MTTCIALSLHCILIDHHSPFTSVTVTDHQHVDDTCLALGHGHGSDIRLPVFRSHFTWSIVCFTRMRSPLRAANICDVASADCVIVRARKKGSGAIVRFRARAAVAPTHWPAADVGSPCWHWWQPKKSGVAGKLARYLLASAANSEKVEGPPMKWRRDENRTEARPAAV